MRRILPLILIFLLISCTTANNNNISNNSTINDNNNEVTNNQQSLPDYFPTELGLIPDYAQIVSIKEKEETQGVDITLASDGSINGLRDHYTQLFDEKNITIEDKDDGYYLTSNKDNNYYTVLISSDTYEGHETYDGKICITLSLQQTDNNTSGKWPTHGVSSHLPKLSNYTNLEVTTFSNDEITITCNTSKETLKNYAQSIINDYPLNQTSIDEDDIYSISGQDNNGLTLSIQHETDTNEAIIQIYIDDYFDLEKDENGVPNWVNTP